MILRIYCRSNPSSEYSKQTLFTIHTHHANYHCSLTGIVNFTHTGTAHTHTMQAVTVSTHPASQGSLVGSPWARRAELPSSGWRAGHRHSCWQTASWRRDHLGGACQGGACCYGPRTTYLSSRNGWLSLGRMGLEAFAKPGFQGESFFPRRRNIQNVGSQ